MSACWMFNILHSFELVLTAINAFLETGVVKYTVFNNTPGLYTHSMYSLGFKSLIYITWELYTRIVKLDFGLTFVLNKYIY